MSDPAARGVIDLHTHTFYSDGVLSPMEQVRRAVVNGYSAIGLTDHTGIGGVARLIEALKVDRELIERHWPIRVVVGVELTHVPSEAIGEAAELARDAGAEIIVVHGETPVEPVPAGTNQAAIASGQVDVLAHPGMLSDEDARLAAENGVYLEITSRRGHSLTNGHVARLAREHGAKLVVNSDAHEPTDLLTTTFQLRVARGAGLSGEEADDAIGGNPADLLNLVLARR